MRNGGICVCLLTPSSFCTKGSTHRNYPPGKDPSARLGESMNHTKDRLTFVVLALALLSLGALASGILAPTDTGYISFNSSITPTKAGRPEQQIADSCPVTRRFIPQTDEGRDDRWSSSH